MTSDSEKCHSNCLICNSKLSSRNTVPIFSEKSGSRPERPLAEIIFSVLEIDISSISAHSNVICRKCKKLFEEVDALECRMSEIKCDICNSYKQTIKKVAESFSNDEEYNDHDYLDTSETAIQEITDVKTNSNLKKRSDTKETIEIENKNNRKEDENESEDNATSIKVSDLLESINDGEEVIIKVEALDNINGEAKRNYLKKLKNMTKEEHLQEKVVSREGSLYTCLLCSPNYEKGDAKSVISHLRTMHNIRLYICDLCGLEFRKRTDLSVHLDDHVAKEEGDFQCENCNRIFTNLRLFRIHKRIHYPQTKSWSCEICGKRYSSRNLLEEHTNTHTGNRPYMCKCGKDFASKYTYKAHVKTHEYRPRPFECSHCSKSFLSQQNLSQHERTHNGVKEYVCDQCGKAFGSPHNLEVHSIVHTGHKPYRCSECGKAFARKAEIRDHERTHTGEKPYQCEHCGSTFSQRSNLQSHKRATHYNDKRYKCDDCGKGFKRRRLLDYHIKAAHTGERPYKCETCTATFVYPEHFKKHMRIHTGEKPFLCEGHLNDTIVVNQPRLTTEEDQVITVEEGNVELLMENAEVAQMQETELYVAGLKNHVIIHQDGNQVYHEGNILSIPTDASEQVQHLVVEGQLLDNEEEESKEDIEEAAELYSYEDGEGEETLVLPGTSGYKEILGDAKNAVRLVQIRIPTSSAGDGRNWLSLVQST
ncbi:zinc finger protein 585A-like isoform X2 [Belonocnema kinseyi]|uniref:zinc finger protein 585A-like isoform X2 n=1 Tax=Belonocnema kinseyi TaxID=2817044 RepID=UPI00143CFAB2|nr:zinc finger protein 585A-like isoform X2 [Belonocnema kinseyi]